MKTKFKLLAVMTMALGLFSCNSEDGVTPKPGLIGNAETYTTIRIAMPGSSNLATKAGTTDPETGDGTEQGTENENKFHDITLYIFDGYDKASTCKGVLTMSNDKFQKREGESVIYETKAPVKVGIEGKDMKVYAVMNGSVIGAGQGITLENFLGKTAKTGETVIGTNKFMMTSRTPATLTLSSTNNNTAEKAASLSVSVERTTAKVSYKANNATNAYDVQNEETQKVVASVTLDTYKLVNLRNDAFYFRKVANDKGNWLNEENFGSGIQTSTNYVIDPKFTEKTPAAVTEPEFGTTWFGADKAYATNDGQYETLPTTTQEYGTLGYCMENTTKDDAQLNGYSTGVIFKATYAPKQVYVLNQEGNAFEVENYIAGTTFYRYGNVLYKDKEEVKTFYSLTDDTLIETFTGDKSKGATCYYKYWIRHMDNKLPEQMGHMEFAIVRNNVYKLDVKTVSGLGDPDDKIDPDTPDESSKMYLKVDVTILPWVVRNNSGIIL